jgi:rubrerythrin
LVYVCMVCEEVFKSNKKQGKIEEEWSNPALCPTCNSDEVREASSKEIQTYLKQGSSH